VTGVLHADPHAGNLLKVSLEDGSITLGYLDFGILSTIPIQVRDALICSVALQVFSRDVNAVSSLFGELQLIPQHILDDPEEKAALADALEYTFENSLIYVDSPGGGDETAIPDLKFDKLLDSLSRLVPRFQFDLPPYFINNARALSTLEGIAKSLDPSFNVLTIMYPYALNRLLLNPSQSAVVERTLQSLIRSGEDERIDRQKIRRLLRDSALISGVPKRRVIWDVVKTKEGRRLAMSIVGEELKHSVNRQFKEGRSKKTKMKKKWYYLEL
jgi:predicted unusual protein kinase regulating ubiquinone biosynthesis (AarF/ABC1/UbiB family)